MLFLECLKQPFFLSPPLRKRMVFTECMEIREMLLHLLICEEQELREKWSNQNQNHPLYERMCQVASTAQRFCIFTGSSHLFLATPVTFSSGASFQLVQVFELGYQPCSCLF